MNGDEDEGKVRWRRSARRRPKSERTKAERKEVDGRPFTSAGRSAPASLENSISTLLL